MSRYALRTLASACFAGGLAVAAPCVARAGQNCENPASKAEVLRCLQTTPGLKARHGGIVAEDVPEAEVPPVPGAPHAATPHAMKPTSVRPRPSASFSIEFASGSAELLPAAMPWLKRIGEAIGDATVAQKRFRIEGHTDTVGTDESNQTLSQARAAAVAAYLEKAYHIDPARLEAVGVGESRLIVPTPDETPNPHNRSVVVINLSS